MKNITLKAFASVAALAVAAGSPAIAQQAAAPQQAAPQIAPVTDAEVTQFVAANGKVATIATEMNSKLELVFNTYNVNILFCTHHLPCRVNEQ